jgi:hypothetical protein
MHLDEQREAIALKPLDDRAFPRWPSEVYRSAVQAADQFAEFAFAAGPGQGGMPHVILKVDIVVLDPHRYRVLVEGIFQTPVPRRLELPMVAKVLHQLLQELPRRIIGQAELQQATDMVGRGARFGDDPRSVKRAKTHFAHGSILMCRRASGLEPDQQVQHLRSRGPA